MVKRLMGLALMLAGAGAALLAAQPQAGQPDYVPVGAVPAAAEVLPVAPMLIGAYAFVWVALIGYVAYMWRRMKRMQDEIASLEARVSSRDGGR
jgi:CcmD family protein